MTEESSNDRLIWLLRISKSMLGTRDLDQLLCLITDAFIEATEAHRGLLLLKDRETGTLIQRVARDKDGTVLEQTESKISTIVNRVFKEKTPVFATSTARRSDPAGGQPADVPTLQMTVCVPLATEKEILGVIYADGQTSLDKVFTQTSRSTFEMLADHAAAAIENARMFERATNDHLTGLPNSSFFLLEVAKVMRETIADESKQGAILLLDLDNFKQVNNVGGAETGDKALIDVGTTLQENLRADGLVSRYGSDKFAILLPPNEDGRMSIRIRDVAERARASVAAKTYHGINLSASIGGLTFPHQTAESAPDLVSSADKLLLVARNRGAGEIEIN